jgi:hypothetical protein
MHRSISFLPCLPMILALAVLPAGGAWEDTGPAAAGRPPKGEAPSRAAPPPPTAATPRPAESVPPDLYSVFLDAPLPRWTIGFLIGGSSDVDGAPDDITAGELSFFMHLLDARDVLRGDIGLDLRPHMFFFPGDADWSDMPSVLLALPLELRWTWRYLNGISFQTGARPGIYSDLDELEGKMFGCPFHLAWHGVVTPRFSWMAGAEVRLGWDMPVMPLAGLAWEPSDLWHIELALPRTRAELLLEPVVAFATFEWRNMTYAMSGAGGKSDEITTEDLLLSGGLEWRSRADWRLAAEIGLLTCRTLTFEGGKEGKYDLEPDTTPFLRLSYGGSF